MHVVAGRRVPTDRPRAVEDPGVFLRGLAELAEALEGVQWMIVSGLAIPLTLRRFYREHRDVDIGAPADQLESIQRAMQRAGYATFTRVAMVGMGHERKVEMYVRCPRADRLLRMRPKNIRFFRAPGRGGADLRTEGFMSWVDLYLYREHDRHLEILDGQIRIPKRAPLVGAHVPLPGGRRVQVVDLHYVKHVKSMSRCHTHRLDRWVMRYGVEGGVARFSDWCPSGPAPRAMAAEPATGDPYDRASSDDMCAAAALTKM